MGPPDAGGLINLARLNLSSRDFVKCLDCCEQAVDATPGGDEIKRLQKVMLDLGQRAPGEMKGRIDAVVRRLAALAPAESLAQPAAATSPPEAAPELVRMIRDIARPSSDGTRHALLPLSDVFGRLLAADLDLGGTLDLALDLTLAATGAKRGFILARDARGKLTVERGRGLESSTLDPAMSTSVLAEVERSHQPVVCEDATRDPRFSGKDSVVRRGVRSIACVPIAPGAGERGILGAIYLEDPSTRGRFGDATSEVLRDLSRLVAGPIRRAQRFAAERRSLAQARAELRRLRGAAEPKVQFVGRSAALQGALDMLRRVAGEEVPVCIQGASGTGKELAARFLHEHSQRADQPLVAENCAALAEDLLESELFGVVKGAYTGADRDRPGLFQKADGGTLFLDEVDELSPACQAMLLRALQEGEVRPVGGTDPISVDVRVVVAAQRELGDLVRQGGFREDLYYRLDVVRIHLPPLRDRREDIPLLVEHFLDDIRMERGDEGLILSPVTMSRLASHDWPGNVRELRNVVWRLAIAGDDGAPWLGAEPTTASSPDGINFHLSLDGMESFPPLKEARAFFEREYVAAVLALNANNVTRAAASLGMQRSHLSRLIKKLGIRR